MKKRTFAVCLAAIQLALSFSSYAGQWQQDQNGWKYKTDSGDHMKSTWYQDSDSRWYYFGPDGYMKSSTMTPDGYVVGSDGAWIEPLGKSGDQAVSPWFYQSMLGKGLDVTWSEFPKQTASYSEQMVKDFKAAGEIGRASCRERVSSPV